MKTRIIETGSSKIEVLLEGEEGPLVVLAPGHGRGGADFSELSLALSSEGWRTAAVNPRGAGQSEGPLDGVTLHDLAADLAGVIESLHGAPAAVVGHAFGNRVARCLAVDSPGLVNCLVLLAAGGKAPPTAEFLDAMKMVREEGRSARDRADALKTAFFASGSDPSFWRGDNWPDASRCQTHAVQATPLDDWWNGGKAPILVIQGMEDICAVPENAYALKREYGDRVTLEEIPKAAHALLSEQPDLIAEKAIAYLRNHHPASEPVRS